MFSTDIMMSAQGASNQLQLLLSVIEAQKIHTPEITSELLKLQTMLDFNIANNMVHPSCIAEVESWIAFACHVTGIQLPEISSNIPLPPGEAERYLLPGASYGNE